MNATPAYAGRAERLFANLIDTVILVMPSAVIASLFGVGGPSLLLAFACNAAYYTVFTASDWQATPGKRLLNIYVARTDGKKLSQRDAIERFLAYIMPSLPIYVSFLPETVTPILVVWLSMFWFAPILYTPNRAGIHDRLCNTRVMVGRLA